MYDEIILDKAVQKAAKNGYTGNIESSGYAPLIFNKDFARALWGEQGFPGEFTGKYPNPPAKDNGVQRGWQYHLQQMVIAPDALKYLSDNMP